MGISEIFLGFLIVIILFTLIFVILRRRRRGKLLNKYGDIEIVNLILAKKICLGMSSEQLRDSWGPPEGISQNVYKTKIKETFKYNKIGKNRFANKVILENEIIIGWSK